MVNVLIYGKMHFCSYPLNSWAVRQKGESQNECYKKTKACQILWKTNISYPVIRTGACAYQGVRNIFFFRKLGVLCFLVTPALIVALFPYYRQIINSSDKKCDQLVDLNNPFYTTGYYAFRGFKKRPVAWNRLRDILCF